MTNPDDNALVEAHKLTHLQMRRLLQLAALDKRQYQLAGSWITSHWSSSRAANEHLCQIGLAERYGQTFYQPSGKICSVGDARITKAGRDYIRQQEANNAGR